LLPALQRASFRANPSQLQWARGITNDSQPPPVTRRQPAAQPAGNPSSRFYNTVAGDYIQLRSSEHSNEEEAWFALLLGFGGCLVGTAVCFFVAFFVLPGRHLFISLGSMLVMFGFSFLIGPINHLKHLITAGRLPFTITYFSGLGLTLYFALREPFHL
ncbi:hypothetical protein B0H19DRAFT_971901, partial [Mycena capillaripes]